jgi:hypothetical protein
LDFFGQKTGTNYAGKKKPWVLVPEILRLKDMGFFRPKTPPFSPRFFCVFFAQTLLFFDNFLALFVPFFVSQAGYRLTKLKRKNNPTVKFLGLFFDDFGPTAVSRGFSLGATNF